MTTPHVIGLDFETFPIEERPHYPPKPVGMAVKFPGEEARYFAWGHASGNNCGIGHAREELYRIHMSGLPIVGHHMKFDLEVARVGLDFPFLRPDHGDGWERIHDTEFLAFLFDPYAFQHDLKGLAETWLGWKPEEQDYLEWYAWQHRETLESLMRQAGYGVYRSGKRNGKPLAGKPRTVNMRQGSKSRGGEATNAAEFYAAMPGDVVAPYAIGDVERAVALFNHWYPKLVESGMQQAYDRERRVLPIFMENERVGMRCDLQRLEADTSYYQGVMRWVEDQLAVRLGVAKGFNFDADEEYAQALVRAGMVREADFPRTATGKYSVSKEALKPEHFADPQFAQVIGYRNRLKTCLTMFMEPWLRQASARPDHHVSTNWNQTRGGDGGTRTGRPSTSEPNFLNISKNFEGRTDGYKHPDFLGVEQLPLVRRYLLPDEGDVWCHRDFSGQEVRMFAHFESGALAEEYRRNPKLDPHEWIKGIILEQTGVELERTRVKNVTFARLYGGGLGAIERQARCASRAEAQQIANFHDRALPGRRIVDDEIKRIARRGDPIRTWGGRLYYREPSSDGRDLTYKLINYLVQGSSADFTKDRLIAWDDFNRSVNGLPPARFLVTVYDEINISAPQHVAREHMAALREIMQAPLLDVPMLSDGKWGFTWGDLEKCE